MIAPQHGQTVSNRARKKSKAGCKTCKLRKVKCDEKIPVCKNCQVYYSNRLEKCDYELPPVQVTIEGNPSRSGKHVMERSLSKRPPPLLPKTVGESTMDPFETQVKSKLPDSQRLLHHYFGWIIGAALPAGHTPKSSPLIQGWFPLVLSDPVMLHVMLQVSALHLEWTRGEPNLFHSSLYARECIHLLRNRVEGEGNAVTDQTIGAVGALACLESDKRNMAMMKMHVDGLKRMVALRGGLHKVRETSPSTANIMYWFTLCITHGSVFPPPPDDEFDPIEKGCINSAPEPSSSSQYLDFREFGIEGKLLRVMLNLRELGHHFLSPEQDENGLTRDVHTPVNLNLQVLLHLKFYPRADDPKECMADACRYACAIFLFSPFNKPYPDWTLVLNSFLHKLKSALGYLAPSRTVPQSQLIVWLLAIGAVTAVDLPERDWFVGHLVAIAGELDLRTWEDFKQAMERVLWVKDCDETLYLALWEEVQAMGRILEQHDPFYSVLPYRDRHDSAGKIEEIADEVF